MSRTSGRSFKGFTLVELVIVITILAIMAGIIATILRGPSQAIVDVQRRTQQVGIVQTALHRMTTEIRLALPYSVRVSGANAVEFLRTFDAGRYRKQGAGRLKFNQSADTFTVLNTLADPGGVQLGSGSTDCIGGSAFCMVVYNIGQPMTVAEATASGLSANAYLGASESYEGNIATVSAAAAHSLSFDNSDLGPPPPQWSFGVESPGQRFHIVDTAVSYVCSGGQITRYAGYAIQPAQPVPPGVAGNLLIDRVSACSFVQTAPTITRFGLLTIRIEITDPDSGETAELVQQVHVTNLP
ncbi:MAG: PulJ/GspJ family protein [Gammaproteobacteria bacterium]